MMRPPPVQLVVAVTPEVAAELQRPEPSGPAAAIRCAAPDLGPQHPGIDDPALSRWFVARVPDAETGERLAEELRALEGVEAAYVKPGAGSAVEP
jgi:hypothetical protein